MFGRWRGDGQGRKGRGSHRIRTESHIRACDRTLVRQPDSYVILRGGPGQAATPAAPALNRNEVRQSRDILLVDHGRRGSAP